MAWKPPASPHEEQRVIDRAYAEYVLPADEAKRLLTGGVKSPRKPNGSPPRKPGSALSGSSSSRRRGGSHRQGQEASAPRPQSGASPRSRSIAQAFELKPGLRPYSAGANPNRSDPNRSSTETYVISASRGSSRPGTPTVVNSPQWSKSPPNAVVLDAHPPSMPRRHSPPGRISEGLEAQLDMTARALTAARSQVDEEKRKAITARKAEDTQRNRAAEARADAERAWTTAWQSAEQQRTKREEQLAARMHADRRKLDTRLQQEAAEQAIGPLG
jgi:hypothetical protein